MGMLVRTSGLESNIAWRVPTFCEDFPFRKGFCFDSRGQLVCVKHELGFTEVITLDPYSGEHISNHALLPMPLCSHTGYWETKSNSIAANYSQDSAVIYGNGPIEILSFQDGDGPVSKLLGDSFFMSNVCGAVIDHIHSRLVLLNGESLTLYFFSLPTYRFCFATTLSADLHSDLVQNSSLAIDPEKSTLLLGGNHGITIFALENGAFVKHLHLNSPDDPMSVGALAVLPGSRIIWASPQSLYLTASDSNGETIAQFFIPHLQISSETCGLSFDNVGGLIALWTAGKIYIVGANQWLPDTYVWSPRCHHAAPLEMRQAVKTFTMLGYLEPSCVISALPNELLFEIFHFL